MLFLLILMLSEGSHLQPHTGVYPVASGLHILYTINALTSEVSKQNNATLVNLFCCCQINSFTLSPRITRENVTEDLKLLRI